MNLQDLKKDKEDKVSALIKECSMFFAFSTEQFHENKTPLQEGEKYVSLGAGAYMPKSSVQKWIDGDKAIKKWYKEAVKSSKLRKENIIYELANHECWYTYDLEPALMALGADYTMEEISAVFNQERENQLA